MATSNTSAPGSISLTRLSLHKKKGDVGKDIRSFVVELTLFEDIFSPTMSGTIIFSDSVALSSQFPLVGGESIQIEFRTPGASDKAVIKKRFIIYKLEAKVMFGVKSVYLAHLISEFAYLDSMVVLSKKVSGNVVNSIKSLLKTDLKVDLLETPLLYDEYDNSVNNINFIIPNWSPIQAITRLTSLSADPRYMVSNGELCGYLFFEDNKGFNYWSLASLTVMDETNSPKAKGNEYFYDSNPNRKNGMLDYKREMQTIQEIRVDTQFDMIDRMITGIYKNQVIEFDILKKTATRLPAYDYMTSIAGKDYSMNSHPISPKGSNFGDGKLNVHTSYNKALNIVDPSVGPVKNRIALGLLTSVKIEITIHGRSDISVGDQLYISIPDMTNSEVGSSNLDKVISGNYLITAIQHRINEFKHGMVLSLSTDSYSIELK